MSILDKATKYNLLIVSYLLNTLIIISCSGQVSNDNRKKTSVPLSSEISERQKEIDEIFSLLAYSIVYADWQEESTPREKRRGYNIGSVLVDNQNKPVFWGLNSIGITNNATQHGEVRLITQYLSTSKNFDLKNHTIYTTLEPCAMCGGMMAMTMISRSVYGQNDVEFSHAIDRLNIDSRPIGGYAPFPRKVVSEASPSEFRQMLNDKYKSFLEKESEKILAKFLVSPAAKEIFKKADDKFKTYEVKYKENTIVYNDALKFYKNYLKDKSANTSK